MKFGVYWKNLLGILVLFAAQSTFAYRVITDRIPIGKGVVYSFVEYNQRKNPTAIGMAISGSAMKTLPEEMQMLDLVPKGKHKIPPYEHFGFDWNPMGHEPPGIYDLPHFDYHFYILPQAVRHAITCQGADEANCMKPVPASYVPMVTLAYLKTKPQMVFPVKQQQNITHTGWYPKNYSVGYKSVTDTYEVALIDLYYRTSSR